MSIQRVAFWSSRKDRLVTTTRLMHSHTPLQRQPSISAVHQGIRTSAQIYNRIPLLGSTPVHRAQLVLVQAFQEKHSRPPLCCPNIHSTLPTRYPRGSEARRQCQAVRHQNNGIGLCLVSAAAGLIPTGFQSGVIVLFGVLDGVAAMAFR